MRHGNCFCPGPSVTVAEDLGKVLKMFLGIELKMKHSVRCSRNVLRIEQSCFTSHESIIFHQSRPLPNIPSFGLSCFICRTVRYTKLPNLGTTRGPQVPALRSHREHHWVFATFRPSVPSQFDTFQLSSRSSQDLISQVSCRCP